MFRSFNCFEGVSPQQWRLSAFVCAIAVGVLALSIAQVLAFAAVAACVALRARGCAGRALWALPGVVSVLALSLLAMGLSPWVCAIGVLALLTWASWPALTRSGDADPKLPLVAHWIFALAALVPHCAPRPRSALRSLLGVSLAAGSASVIAQAGGAGGSDLDSATDALTASLASIGGAVRNVLYGLAALTVIVCGGAAFMGRFPAKWLWTVGGGVLAMAAGGLVVDLLISDAADSEMLYDHELQ